MSTSTVIFESDRGGWKHIDVTNIGLTWLHKDIGSEKKVGLVPDLLNYLGKVLKIKIMKFDVIKTAESKSCLIEYDYASYSIKHDFVYSGLNIYSDTITKMPDYVGSIVKKTGTVSYFRKMVEL